MQDLNLSSLFDLSFDVEPLLWVIGSIVGAFTLCVLFVVPIAVFGKGEVGANARAVLKLLLGVFHAGLDALKHRRCGR